ncbi:MAG: alpha-amylase family protein [Candidatus Nanopelagicaceae bacterium]
MSSQAIAASRQRLAKALSGDPDLNGLLDRFDRYVEDLWDGIEVVYDAHTLLPQIVDVIARIHKARSAELRHRDNQRILQPDWFQDPSAIGYVCYTDLFAGNLQGIRSKIGYLKELGVTYLHLMPLLNPRPGNSDGGYAVMDYKSVRPDLGTMKDLAELASDLHQAGISLTLDLVLNHVAKEHEWALKARAGEARYLDYFYAYSDRKIPDQYEKSLPEIFPTFAPGNFTYYEDMGKYVWTTFNEFQWDVNWSNPNLFLEYVDIIGYLANQGTDCVRLDAIAFIWKRLGTNCQNQPEVHSITQALRAISKIVTPALIYKAEAIVGPQDVVHYLGQGEHAGKVSDLAYHNSLMVQIWSALASRDGRLLDTALNRFAPVPTTSAWATYLRCHDDIGWAIDDSDAAAAGINGGGHRNFCADFYRNEFPGSFARGVHFQSNPLTGDRRTSGSAASLIGIERAIENKDAADLNVAINRLICAYAIVFGFGGIPLLYMGDELGMLNDESYKNDPAKADDNRWIHRPKMDWELAKSASNGEGVAGRVYEGITKLIKARKSLDSIHASVTAETEARNDGAILLIRRKHAAGLLTEIYNLTEKTQYLDSYGVAFGDRTEAISGRQMHFAGQVAVPPYAAWWIHA